MRGHSPRKCEPEKDEDREFVKAINGVMERDWPEKGKDHA